MPALTPEEKVLMDECRSESFYYRALPIGVTFSSLVQLGIANGKIAAPTTTSKIIKMFAAGTAGYMLGKASYAGACREKFLQKAPDSNISKMLRGEQVQQQQVECMLILIFNSCSNIQQNSRRNLSKWDNTFFIILITNIFPSVL